MWVENFIRAQRSSPTESALGPPYGEIQESYLIYNENAMQQCSPIESALDSSYDKFKRLCVWFINQRARYITCK